MMTVEEQLLDGFPFISETASSTPRTAYSNSNTQPFRLPGFKEVLNSIQLPLTNNRQLPPAALPKINFQQNPRLATKYERALVIQRTAPGKDIPIISFVCEICSQPFTRRDNLKQHMDTVHGDKRHPCSMCSKTFTQSGSLNLHIKTVHGGKRIPCDKCEKTYARIHGLRQHYQSVHEGKQIPCEHCGEQFKSRYYLSRHLKSIHAGLIHSCKFCKLHFNDQRSMNEHIAHTHVINGNRTV